MNKLKLLFIVFILFVCPNVFAQNVTSSIRCSYNGSGSTYYGDPNDGFNSARCYDTGTRYSPRLGYIEFYIPTSSISLTAGKSYTVTMNMATSDWRNNIMIQNVRYINSSGSVVTSSLPSMTNFRFISMKQIKFDFTLPTGTIYPYLRFILSSTTYANPDPDISSSKYITGNTNWNLSSIDISPVSSSSGGSSGSYDDSGVINNNNQNTDNIINNQNELLSSACSNILDISSASVIGNGAFNVFYNTSTLQFTGTSTNVNGSNFVIYTLNVIPHTNYYFSLSNGYKVSILDSSYNELYTSTSNYFTFNSSGYYTLLLGFFAPYNDTAVYTNVMVSSNNGSFCVYGSSTSKIDAASSAIQGAINGASEAASSTIINNQDENTNKQIESQKVCKNIGSKYITIKTSYLDNNGNVVSNNYFQGITDYIKIDNSSTLTALSSSPLNGNYLCFYNNSKVKISCLNQYNFTNGMNITIPNNAYYFRSSIINERPLIRVCYNGNQALNDTINDTNEYLKDNSDPNIDNNEITSLFSNVGYSDPLNYLLQLPTMLINKLVSLSDSCQSINLGTLLGSPIIFPCINLENIVGSSVWNTIDVICTVGLLVVIFKNLYETFANLMTMGGEKEAREKFNMPTPMEFLSYILGGDR